MKTIKAGQFWAHNGVILRARKRTSGCEGCLYEDCILCPDVKTKTNENQRPYCTINDIILVKP